MATCLVQLSPPQSESGYLLDLPNATTSSELLGSVAPMTERSINEPKDISSPVQSQPFDYCASYTREDTNSGDPGCTRLAYMATSQNTFTLGSTGDHEQLEGYQAGGYHPVHPGDILDRQGRYRVLRKLGFGGFSTVWLCRDYQQGIYVAIKIHMASVTAERLLELRLKDLKGVESAFINILLDHFTLEGPNGIHQCLVNKLMGPCVSPYFEYNADVTASALREMCRQATVAMRFLHQNGICHGDFRPTNILIRIEGVESLGEDQLLPLLDSPLLGYGRTRVFRKNNERLPPGTPSHLYYPVDIYNLIEYFAQEICVIDFGESFLPSIPPPYLGVGLPYRAPELYFGKHEDPVSQACDLWTLGCTLYAIRYQGDLFGGLDEKDLIHNMVRILGELPDRWASKEDHSFYCQLPRDRRSKETRAGREGIEQDSIDAHLHLPLQDGEIFPSWYCEAADSGRFDEDPLEAKAIKETLLKLLRYEPNERISADEVLKLDWLREDMELPAEKLEEAKSSEAATLSDEATSPEEVTSPEEANSSEAATLSNEATSPEEANSSDEADLSEESTSDEESTSSEGSTSDESSSAENDQENDMEIWVDILDGEELGMGTTHNSGVSLVPETSTFANADFTSMGHYIPTSFPGAIRAPKQVLTPGKSLPGLSPVNSFEGMLLGVVCNDELEVVCDLEFTDDFDAEEELLIVDPRKVTSEPEVMEKSPKKLNGKTWSKKGKWRVSKQRMGQWLKVLKGMLCGGIEDQDENASDDG